MLIGCVYTVALRKESVDRNDTVKVVVVVMHASLSARRAWIEIKSGLHPLIASLVALRKESVDRNSATRIYKKIENSRSPQGERG